LKYKDICRPLGKGAPSKYSEDQDSDSSKATDNDGNNDNNGNNSSNSNNGKPLREEKLRMMPAQRRALHGRPTPTQLSLPWSDETWLLTVSDGDEVAGKDVSGLADKTRTGSASTCSSPVSTLLLEERDSTCCLSPRHI